MFEEKRGSSYRCSLVVSTVILLLIVVFGKGAMGQESQIANDSLRKYLQNRDWPKEFACAMFVELTVDVKDERNANFSEYWYLYSRSVDANSLRLDSQRQSKFDLTGEYGRGLSTSFYAVGDESFFYVGNSATPTGEFNQSDSSKAENPVPKLVYVNPFELSFVGWSGFEDQDVPSARPDYLRRIFGRYEEISVKKVRNLEICEFKVFPDDVLFDTVEFDAQFGDMPIALKRERRNGAKATPVEKIETSWKSNDRSHWYPHDVSIDTYVSPDTRKTWKIKYYWKLGDLGTEIFDPTNGGAVHIEQLRNEIVATAFNRR